MSSLISMSCGLQRIFVVLFTVVSLVRASYDPFNYDLGVSQFTPDGRLLQVEYAAKAASQEDSAILVAQIQSKEKDNTLTVVCTSGRADSVVDRMVHLPDSDTILILTGLLPDAVRLVRLSVDKTQDEFHRMWGNDRPLSSFQIASAIANTCQRHSMGGGMRCYGASIVVVENVPEEEVPRIYQTHTSGSVQRYSMKTDGKVLLIGEERRNSGKSSSTSQAPQGGFSSLSSFLEYASERLLPTPDPEKMTEEEEEHDDGEKRILHVSLLSRKHGIRRLSQDELEDCIMKKSRQR